MNAISKLALDAKNEMRAMSGRRSTAKVSLIVAERNLITATERYDALVAKMVKLWVQQAASATKEGPLAGVAVSGPTFKYVLEEAINSLDSSTSPDIKAAKQAVRYAQEAAETAEAEAETTRTLLSALRQEVDLYIALIGDEE